MIAMQFGGGSWAAGSGYSGNAYGPDVTFSVEFATSGTATAGTTVSPTCTESTGGSNEYSALAFAIAPASSGSLTIDGVNRHGWKDCL